MKQTVCNFLQCNMLDVQLKERYRHMSQTDGGGAAALWKSFF